MICFYAPLSIQRRVLFWIALGSVLEKLTNAVLKTFGWLDDVVVFPEIGFVEVLGHVVKRFSVVESILSGNGLRRAVHPVGDHHFVDGGKAGGKEASLPVAIETESGSHVADARDAVV